MLVTGTPSERLEQHRRCSRVGRVERLDREAGECDVGCGAEGRDRAEEAELALCAANHEGHDARNDPIDVGRSPDIGAEGRLRALEIDLPRPPLALGAYAAGKLVGNLLFLSGAYGTRPDASGATDTLPVRGRVGDELTIAEGQASARLVAINLLAMAQAVVGDLDRVRSVVRLVGYINAAPGFVDAPRVLDGASQL